jgi:hypothetical protein
VILAASAALANLLKLSLGGMNGEIVYISI